MSEITNALGQVVNQNLAWAGPIIGLLTFGESLVKMLHANARSEHEWISEFLAAVWLPALSNSAVREARPGANKQKPRTSMTRFWVLAGSQIKIRTCC